MENKGPINSQWLTKSPLLKGGQALHQTVQAMMNDRKKTNEFSLLKGAKEHHVRQLFNSPSRKNEDIGHSVTTVTALEDVQMQIANHERKIESTKQTMIHMHEQTTCCQQHISKLERRMKSQQKILDQVIQQTHKALEHQGALLTSQHALIQQIRTEATFNWFPDAFHFALTLYVLNTPTIKFALAMIVHKLTSKQKQRVWLLWCLRLFVFIYMFKVARFMDRKLGIVKLLSTLAQSGYIWASSFSNRIFKLSITSNISATREITPDRTG